MNAVAFDWPVSALEAISVWNMKELLHAARESFKLVKRFNFNVFAVDIRYYVGRANRFRYQVIHECLCLKAREGGGALHLGLGG